MVTLIINFYYIFSASNKLHCLSDSTTSPPNYRKSDSEELAKLIQGNKSHLSNNDRVGEQKRSTNQRK